jgi:hypothetical protein
MERFFVWLSGTSRDTLVLCGLYERMKYAALGATLLVPAVTGMLAGYYTIHSLTQSPVLSGGIAAFWALALVVIDRAILVTSLASMGSFIRVRIAKPTRAGPAGPQRLARSKAGCSTSSATSLLAPMGSMTAIPILVRQIGQFGVVTVLRRQ